MEKKYTFALDSILKGQTVLVYSGLTAARTKHVKTANRLALVNGVLYCDGVSCKGMTMAIRPKGWK